LFICIAHPAGTRPSRTNTPSNSLSTKVALGNQVDADFISTRRHLAAHALKLMEMRRFHMTAAALKDWPTLCHGEITNVQASQESQFDG
jgi:hypothetical protein